MKWTEEQVEVLLDFWGETGNFKATADKMSDYFGQPFTRDMVRGKVRSAIFEQAQRVNAHRPQLLNKLAMEKATTRELRKTIESMEARLAAFEAMADQEFWAYDIEGPDEGKRVGTPVGLLSDWHWDQMICSDATNGINSFGPEEAEKRVKKLLKSLITVLKIHEQHTDFPQIVLGLLGDFFSGHIHEHLKEVTTGSPIESILAIRPVLHAFITAVKQEFPNTAITVPCVHGNHSRDTKKLYSDKSAEHSYEWIMYNELANDFKKDDQVQVLTTRSEFLYLPIHDYVCRFHHGHRIRHRDAIGGPVAALKRIMYNGWDRVQKADYTFTGHFHRYSPFEAGVLNGSMIGASPYSIYSGFDGEDPCQAFAIIDSKLGMIHQTKLMCV